MLAYEVHVNFGCGVQSYILHVRTTHLEFHRVNTVLSNLKTAISGVYHHFDFAKYADRHLAQVQYCFNRCFDLKSFLI